MNFLRLAVAVSVSFLLGCSAAGVVESSDPATKLAQARQLLQLDRGVPAERLVREAMQTYTAREDAGGLAGAQVAYGLLLVDPAYRSHEKIWRLRGDYDSSSASAINYINSALALYAKIDDVEGERSATFQLGRLYADSGEANKACESYEKSVRFHHLARARFPGHDYYVASGTKSYEETVKIFKDRVPC